MLAANGCYDCYIGADHAGILFHLAAVIDANFNDSMAIARAYSKNRGRQVGPAVQEQILVNLPL